MAAVSPAGPPPTIRQSSGRSRLGMKRHDHAMEGRTESGAGLSMHERIRGGGVHFRHKMGQHAAATDDRKASCVRWLTLYCRALHHRPEMECAPALGAAAKVF